MIDEGMDRTIKALIGSMDEFRQNRMDDLGTVTVTSKDRGYSAMVGTISPCPHCEEDVFPSYIHCPNCGKCLEVEEE